MWTTLPDQPQRKPTRGRCEVRREMSGRILPGSQESWCGGEISNLTECVLAPNPSPWTLDGTNTWIVGEPGGSCVVIDPGPITNGHGQAIEDTLDRRNASPVAVLLTHGHVDHAEGAVELAQGLGVALRAWDADLLRIRSKCSAIRITRTRSRSKVGLLRYSQHPVIHRTACAS